MPRPAAPAAGRRIAPRTPSPSFVLLVSWSAAAALVAALSPSRQTGDPEIDSPPVARRARLRHVRAGDTCQDPRRGGDILCTDALRLLPGSRRRLPARRLGVARPGARWRAHSDRGGLS